MSSTKDLSDPIALRIPREVLRNIEAIAVATDRTRSWVIVRALKAYLAAEGSDILEAEKGKAEIAAGLSHELDSVLEELEARRPRDAA